MKSIISILIIDDEKQKADRVKVALETFISSAKADIRWAKGYGDARDALLARTFDFVVLDTKLQDYDNSPSESVSRRLLEEIESGQLCFPVHVFGLTQHEELMLTEGPLYADRCFGYYHFSWASDNWAKAIAKQIDYLVNALKSGSLFRINSFEYDLLIVTARGEGEFYPIRKVFFGDEASVHHPLLKGDCHLGEVSFDGVARPLRVALICLGQTGLSVSAASTMQMIHLLRPRVVAMLGMCAGFSKNKVSIMDVLIATESKCWQEGRFEKGENGEEFRYRAKPRNASSEISAHFCNQIEMRGPEIRELCTIFSRRAEHQLLRSKFGDSVADVPSVKDGLVVSGSAVVASNETVKEIIDNNPTAIGLEMEIFSVYVAAEKSLGRKPDVIAIKSVADLADEQKRSEAQPLASELSAVVFKHLFTNWLKDREAASTL